MAAPPRATGRVLTKTTDIPPNLLEGGALPETRGSLEGRWLVEESPGAARVGLHVEATLHEEVSDYQKIAVYDTSFFGRVLTLDDVIMLTERDEFVYHEMIVHVPLCSMPDPRSVLIIGGGDCGTLREVLKHPTVERVVQCELDERVTGACRGHFPWVEDAIGDPRVELVFEDGSAYVDASPTGFDLVVVDSTDPKGPGADLFLRSFYRKAAAALRRGGVLSAQAESPHWDPAMVAAIYGELRAAFEHVAGHLCMIPTYQSGCWNLAYASNDRRHDEFFDRKRAAKIAAGCLYYNEEIHDAAFCLPGFARRVVAEGVNPFARFDERYRRTLGR